MGILYETRKQKFDQVHSQFSILVKQFMQRIWNKKLIHVSALGVKEKHNSLYMQSKLEGEKKFKKILNGSSYFKTFGCFWSRR